jgi:hypothetical protein
MRDMIIGFRKSDGHIEYVDYGRDKTTHFAQIMKEQDRRAKTIQVKNADTEGPMRGVPQIIGKNTIDDILKAVNPHYVEGREWSNNCANCAVATELRYRGYDVEAKPRDFSRENTIPNWYNGRQNGRGSWTDSFDGLQLETVPATRKSQLESAIIKKMQEYGDNSRAVIFIQWDGATVGHYFNVVNEGGHIKFIDTQKGTKDADVIDYFKTSKPSMIRIWRTDDKDITEFARKVVDWNE